MRTNGAAAGQAVIADRPVGLPPGPRTPRAVQLLSWLPRPLQFLEDCHARYGEIFTIHIRASKPWVFISNPEHIKRVFTADTDVVLAGAENALMLGPYVGRASTIILDGAAHMRRRKLVLPPFHGARVKTYGETVVDVVRREIDTWPVGEPFSLLPGMGNITLEVIMRAVFGVTEEDHVQRLGARLHKVLEDNTDHRFVARLVFRGAESVERNARFRRAMDPVDEMLLEEVRRRRADPDVDQHDDVLAMLIQARYEDGSQMSDEELRDEIKTLLVAGHDTTTATLTWVFERLLRHPDKLQRIQDELRAGEDSGYIDAVIQETMRLRPSVMAAMRRITEPLELGGYTLPAGTSVYVSIYLTHRRADIYPEPESFRPERFMERAPGTYTWLPFGGGVRRCIGAAFAMYEMRKVIETIVREADLRAVDPRPEGIARGWVTFIPDKGTRVVMNARRRPDTAGAPAQSSTPASTPTSTPA